MKNTLLKSFSVAIFLVISACGGGGIDENNSRNAALADSENSLPNDAQLDARALGRDNSNQPTEPQAPIGDSDDESGTADSHLIAASGGQISVDNASTLSEPAIPGAANARKKLLGTGNPERTLSDPDPTWITHTSGRPRDYGAYGFLARVYIEGKAQCGGVLVHHLWVLTSDLCIQNAPDYKIKVKLTSVDSGPDYEYDVTTVKFFKPFRSTPTQMEVISNRFYKLRTFVYDKSNISEGGTNDDNLALLKIKRNKKYKGYMGSKWMPPNPIELPASYLSYKAGVNGGALRALGWGLSDNLGADRTPIIPGWGFVEPKIGEKKPWALVTNFSDYLRSKDYESANSPLRENFCKSMITSADRDLCVTNGVPSTFKDDITAGDLGGPLIWRKEKGAAWKLAGIASYIKILNLQCAPLVIYYKWENTLIETGEVKYSPDYIARCEQARYGVYSNIVSNPDYIGWINKTINRVFDAPCVDCSFKSRLLIDGFSAREPLVLGQKYYKNGDELFARLEVDSRIDDFFQYIPTMQLEVQHQRKDKNGLDYWYTVRVSHLLGDPLGGFPETGNTYATFRAKIFGVGSDGLYRFRMIKKVGNRQSPIAYTFFMR